MNHQTYNTSGLHENRDFTRSYCDNGGMPDREHEMHVLVVDDDAAIRRLVVELLRDAGHVVYEAERGDDGIDMAHAVHPDVILMDLMLPGISGLEATRRLKHADDTSHIRVIAMSAVDRELFSTSLLADAFLRKPFDLDQLLALVVATNESFHD